MSKFLDLFEVGGGKPTSRSAEEMRKARASYGITDDLTSAFVISEFLEIDSKQFCDKSQTSAVDGAKLAITAVDILRGNRKPDFITTEEGKEFIRPILFNLGEAGLEGFGWVLEECFVGAPGVTAKPENLLNLTELEKPKEVLTAEHRSGITSVLSVLPLQDSRKFLHNKHVNRLADPVLLVFDVPSVSAYTGLTSTGSEA